jgi:fatty acid desaturase
MSEFYITLKQKIEDHFIQKKTSPRYAPEMLFRSLFLVSTAFMFHYLSVVTESLPLAILCALIAGVEYALISFMPVHEGSHASSTESPLVWRLLGSVHDFVNGASFYTWCHQHFLGHHPFTNLTNGQEIADSLDPDVCTNDPDIRRIKPSQRWYSHYRFQQFYVPMLYGLLGIKYRINDFVIMFVSKTNGKIKVNPPDTWHLSMFLLGKTFFLLYRVIIPTLFVIPLWRALLLFVLSDFLTSYVLAFVFQVNHVVPQAKWPKVDKRSGKVDMDWAEMQLRTTLDYAHGSWWTTFFTGALNYQVTHHLFPYICQLHYPDIAPIIKQHCKKYDLPYHHLPNFWEALKAHLKYLAIMGHEHHDF